jgi:membrane-associated phospholipid phosphatase
MHASRRSGRRALCTAFFIAIGATHATPVRAQALGSEKHDIATFTGDIWSVWTSPAHFDHRDVVPLALTVGAFGLATRIDSATRVWMVTHERTAVMRVLSPTREGFPVPAYELGSGQYLLPLSGALYLSGRLSHSVNLRDAGLGCAAGHLASLGIRSVTYRLVARARPRITPNPLAVGVPGSHDWFWHSFFSGHIANSMACASFLGHRYSLGIAEPLPYAYSTVIGLGRMADGEHWASDTMLGAIVGFAIGREIAARQLDRRASAATNRSTSSSASTTRRLGTPILVPLVTLSF